jgi:hypothetical protein
MRLLIVLFSMIETSERIKSRSTQRQGLENGFFHDINMSHHMHRSFQVTKPEDTYDVQYFVLHVFNDHEPFVMRSSDCLSEGQKKKWENDY